MACMTPAGGSGGAITCSAATFPAGATASFTLIGHVPPGTPSGTVFMNVAAVSASSVDPNNENNSASSSMSLLRSMWR